VSQALVNALLTGGLYAALGIGLSLVYGVTRVINAAHGAYIVLGAFLTWAAWKLIGIDPFAMIPALLAVGFVLGYVVQRLLINAVVTRYVLMTVAMTFGIDLILVTGILVTWGADLRIVNVSYAAEGFDLLGARVPIVRLLIFVVALGMAVALELIVRRTTLGAQIRAVSQDRPAAELLGIDVGHTYGVAHGLAAAVACAAGAMVAMIMPLQPFLGVSLLLIAFAVVVLAGFGPIAPVIVAGVILALSEQLVGLYLGTDYQRLAIFAVYLAVATVRPHGLFGARFYAH
jgi:branched-chain amino acid transport system permease protein